MAHLASTHLASSVFQIASPVLSKGNYPVTLRLLHTQPLLSSTCNLPSNQGLPSDQYLLCKVRLLFKTQSFNPHLLRMHTMVKVCFNDQETTNLRLCFLINFICDYHLHIFCFTLIGLANVWLNFLMISFNPNSLPYSISIALFLTEETTNTFSLQVISCS